MVCDKNLYDFEKAGQFTVRTRDKADPEVKRLVRRLGLNPHDIDETTNRALENFVINHHLAIEFYQEKIKKIVFWRKVYMFASMTLLLALPVFVVIISKVFDAENLEILTSIIAGVFAFYRGMSAWADKRLVAGAFSDASSKLKEAVYTFEQTWDQRSKLAVRPDAFILAAEAATDAARRTIHNEQNIYFRNLSYPSFDLGSILSSTGNSAKSLVSSYAVAAPEPPKMKRDTVDELQIIDAEINQNQARLNQILVDIAALPSNAAKSRRQALEEAREDALDMLRTAELKRAVAMSDLEALHLTTDKRTLQ